MNPPTDSAFRGPMEERLLIRIRLMNGVIFALFLAGSLVFMSPFFTIGVALGGVVVLANFHLLHRILKKAFNPAQLASPKSVMVKYYLRLLAIGIVLYVFISKKWADPMGLVVGLSIVVINLTLVGLNEMRKILVKEAN